MLHKAQKMIGYHIHATDGEVGHVDELLFDESGWKIRYLVVDTSNWIGGRSVLISTAVVDKLDSPNQKIHVKLTREQIEKGPSSESAQIELIETVPSIWII
jgi:hypothetical protein